MMWFAASAQVGVLDVGLVLVPAPPSPVDGVLLPPAVLAEG